jgi:hypothetical protein
VILKPSSRFRRVSHWLIEQLGGESGCVCGSIDEAGDVSGGGGWAGVPDVSGDVGDVGAGCVERRDDGAAAYVRAESCGIESDPFGCTAEQFVDLLAGDEPPVGLGEQARSVATRSCGSATAVRRRAVPRSGASSRLGAAGWCLGKAMNAGRCCRLGRAESSTVGTVDDGSAHVRGARLNVDVGPCESEDLAHSEADGEQDRHGGAVAVTVGLGDQTSNLVEAEHTAG